MNWWVYFCTQFGAVVQYLRLSLWPDPLVFDYGTRTAHGAMEIVPYAIVVGLLGLATLVALWRWPKVGLFGAWFFAILAPTVELRAGRHADHGGTSHVLAVGGGRGGGGDRRIRGRPMAGRPRHVIVADIARRWRCLIVCVTMLFAALTSNRNDVYRSPLSIWYDIVKKLPDSDRAHINLAVELMDSRSHGDAIAECREALELNPNSADAHNNLGRALMTLNRREEAMAEYREALKIQPDLPWPIQPWRDTPRLGQPTTPSCIFVRPWPPSPIWRRPIIPLPSLWSSSISPTRLSNIIGRPWKSSPTTWQLTTTWGMLLKERGRIDEAIVLYRKALTFNPTYALAHCNLGIILAATGRVDEAIAEYQRALEINPRFPNAYYNLGDALVRQSRFHEAAVAYRNALTLQPGWAAACNQLARLLAMCPDASIRNGVEAVALARQAVQLTGGQDPAALDTLAAAYAEAGRFPEAIQTARRAVELAKRQNNGPLLDAIQNELRLYEAGKPLRAM